MTEKSQQITFTKGITNQPSDAICSDGELSNCVGLTAEYGELKPIQKPVDTGLNLNAKLWYVHGDRYISLASVPGHGSTTRMIVWERTSGSPRTGIVDSSYSGGDITSIGNTLIVSSSDEMHYYLWKGNGYQDLGTKIPEPEVKFQMAVDGDDYFWQQTDNGMGHDGRSVPPDKQSLWNDTVTGIFYEGVSYLHRRKLFMRPFVAMVAVELYDGSYTLHSNPFIMTPWLQPDILALMNYNGNDADTQFIYLYGSSLMYNLNVNYDDWSDIVRGVSLFISREINMFKTDATWIFSNNGEWYYPAGDSGSRDNDSPIGGYMFDNNSIRTWKSVVKQNRPSLLNYNNCFKIFVHRESSEIQKDLESESVFFKLCDLKSNGYNWDNVGNLFSDTTLDNIEAQQQLPNADYHTHDKTTGSQTYAYNGRLHLAGIKRTLFDGFKTFSYWNTASGPYTYTIDVSIRISSGETKTVRQTVYTSEAIGQTYIFYPDPRAKSVTIYASNGTYVTRTLREHPGLNGAYWYSIPNPVFVPGSSTISSPIYAPNPTGSSGSAGADPDPIVEEIVDTIAVSEVDNPFLFLAKGYVKVNAPVVGMAAVTMALSEYQHGHQPLVVFTEKGIWSLSLNAEGYYTSVQAVSREVCNNASSITQVDNGIYFVSQKGLMYLNTAGVRCVSDQMRGTDFDEFIDNCMIAYDYRDSLLHIYPKPNNAQGFGDTYVYNMKTGTFSMLQDSFTNVVNNYPDTLVQDSLNNTYSFLQKPDEQSDNTSYGAYIKTRPMKLENALALKSILQVRHIHTIKFSQTTTLKFKVYASNNLDRAQNTWVQLTSLRGRPWKYYKFVYEFTGLKATDRFAGTMLITQERRTDKLR